MKVKLKVKVLVIGLCIVAAAFAGIFIGVKLLYEEIVTKKLISAIIDADPEGDDNVYVYLNGYGSSRISEQKVTNEQAIRYVNRMIDDFPDHDWTMTRAEWTLAHLYLKQKEREKAAEIFKKIAADSDTYSEYQVGHAKQWLRILDPNPPKAGAEPVLSGRVWIGDEPANNVMVYLMRADTNYWRSHPRITQDPITITDESGIYRFYGYIEPGEYAVGIGAQPSEINGYVMTEQEENTVTIDSSSDQKQFDVRFVEQVNVKHPIDGETFEGDTITLEWESYPGAVSYNVGIGELLVNEAGEINGSSMIYLSEEWKGTKAQYSIEQLRKRFPDYSSYSSAGLSPGSVLGFVYPGGTFTWGVYAIDENGNKLSSSNAVYIQDDNRYPIFKIDDAGQLEGDRYVISGDFDQAIEAYEQKLDDPYALRALAQIHHKGIDEHLKYQDLDKALEYAKRIPDLTEYEQEWVKRIEREKGKPPNRSNMEEQPERYME